MTIVIGCLRQYILQSSFDAWNTITWQSKLYSNFIGSAKTNTIYILCQLVGILTDDFNRFLSILLIDARSQVHRHIVRLQKEMKFLDLTLFSPGFCNLLTILDTYTFHLAQPFRLLFDNRQCLLSKVLDDALSLLWTNTLNQTRTKVASDTLDRSGKPLGEAGYVQLSSILRILFPISFD